MTQDQHVYAICCRLEVADDVVSSQNEKTIEGYLVVDYEVAISNSFRDIQRKSCRDGGYRRQQSLSENALSL